MTAMNKKKYYMQPAIEVVKVQRINILDGSDEPATEPSAPSLEYDSFDDILPTIIIGREPTP